MLIVVIYLVAATVFTASGLHHRGRNYRYQAYDTPVEAQYHSLWNPKLFVGVAIGTLAVIGIGSGFKRVLRRRLQIGQCQLPGSTGRAARHDAFSHRKIRRESSGVGIYPGKIVAPMAVVRAVTRRRPGAQGACQRGRRMLL